MTIAEKFYEDYDGGRDFECRDDVIEYALTYHKVATIDVINQLIEDYDADIKGCSADELLRYTAAIRALEILKKRLK